MRKNTILYFLVIFCVYNLHAQQIDVPEFERIAISNSHHVDSLGNYEDQYSDNKILQIQYIEDSDSTMLRKDFDEQGKLTSQISILKRIGIDTFDIWDSAQKLHKIAFRRTVFDLPHGTYKKIYKYDDKTPIHFENGKVDKGIRIGEWHFVNVGMKKIVNFNSSGHVEGLYQEYKKNLQDQWVLTCSGKFGYIEYSDRVFNYDRYTYSIEKKTLLTRVGVWDYYDVLGEKIGTVDYSWK